MNSFVPNRSNRRKFFSTAGRSSIGLLLMSSFPMNIFGKNNMNKKLKEVHTHPHAVKRVEKIK